MRNMFVKMMACLAVLLVVIPSNAAVTKRSLKHSRGDDDVTTEIGIGQGYPMSEDDAMMGYMKSAMVNPSGLEDYTLDISASFLWWHISQDQMEFATGVTSSGEYYVLPPFTYYPAFKVMLGGSLWHDGWMGSIMYTRINNGNCTRTVNPPTNGQLYGIAGWLHPDYIQDDASAGASQTAVTTSANLGGGITFSWKNKLDKLDFCVSRAYYSGKNLIVSPRSGICLAWIEQRVEITAVLDSSTDVLTTSTTTTTTLDSQSWLVGPSMQMDFKWLLGYGVRFNGSLGGTIFFQNFDVTGDYGTGATTPLSAAVTPGSTASVRAAPTPISITLTPVRRDLMNFHCMGSMGLGWGSYVFEDDACNIDLSLNYEFNYWFGQNVIRQITAESRILNNFPVNNSFMTSPNNVSTHATAPGGLRYHGITLTLCIDF